MHPNVDLAALYRDHFAQTRFKPKSAQHWDERAARAGDAYGKPDSAYVVEFLRGVDLDGARSLLDVGCGPGTIGLPLAGSLDHVFALDFSSVMLDTLRKRARAMDVNNVTCLHRSWHDDWHDVPACDIVIASRCMLLPDLHDALQKLVARTRVRAYTSHIAYSHHVSADVIKHIGRQAAGAPDHIYALGILHQMGIRASVRFLEASVDYVNDEQLSEEDFIARVARTVDDLSSRDIAALRTYYQRHAPAGRLGLVHDKTWAFVSWAAD